MTDTTALSPIPTVRGIGTVDTYQALRAGLSDFQRAPLFGLFFGALFSVFGILIAWGLVQGEASYWILPAAAGFPLVGPFAAVGLYEVSRRLERGEPLQWWPVLTSGFTARGGQLPFFAVLAIFVFLVWIVLARVIFAVSFGTASMTNIMTSFEVFFTFQGILMLAIGSTVGAALATLLFSISVVGVPLLVDRDIDVVTAMITSFKATVENRSAMFLWGCIVAVTSIFAMLPLFLGMILVFPMLGHSAWHLFRMVIEPEG
ncbi:MAG: DUF2189 domain-containing protein [Rhodobacteraceae bacterium]|nr:DUF2189 domain-containing protein [Paracoccaceae bacterium]